MGDESKDWNDWLDQYANEIGNISIDLNNYQHNDDNTITISGWEDYKDWIYNPDQITHDDIKLTGGGEEMLRIDKDGFYVRGVRVEADNKEAEQVYKAFKEWLTWANLSKNNEE